MQNTNSKWLYSTDTRIHVHTQHTQQIFTRRERFQLLKMQTKDGKQKLCENNFMVSSAITMKEIKKTARIQLQYQYSCKPLILQLHPHTEIFKKNLYI